MSLTRIKNFSMIAIGISLIIGGAITLGYGISLSLNKSLIENFNKPILKFALYGLGPIISICGALHILYCYFCPRNIAIFVFF